MKVNRRSDSVKFYFCLFTFVNLPTCLSSWYPIYMFPTCLSSRDPVCMFVILVSCLHVSYMFVILVSCLHVSYMFVILVSCLHVSYMFVILVSCLHVSLTNMLSTLFELRKQAITMMTTRLFSCLQGDLIKMFAYSWNDTLDIELIAKYIARFRINCKEVS